MLYANVDEPARQELEQAMKLAEKKKWCSATIRRLCWALLRQVTGASLAKGERYRGGEASPFCHHAATRVRFRAAAVARCCK